MTDMVENENFQWIWGVLSAFPKNLEKDSILKYKLPQAEGNTGIWQEPISIQYPFAEIEIVAWDSSKTILLVKIMISLRNLSIIILYRRILRNFVDEKYSKIILM